MLTLMCQVLLTRRQDMCYVVDEESQLLWSGKEIRAAMEWLIENEHHEFRLVDGSDEDALHITARRV